MPEPELSPAATVAAADVDTSTSVLEEARRSTRQHRPRHVDNSLTGDEVFDLLDHFILEDDDDASSKQRKRRKRTMTASQRHKRAKKSTTSASEEDAPLMLLLEKESMGASSPDTNPKREPPALRPRWYNQMYVMFLALRQSPGYTSSRSELVRSAVELDRRISVERGLPRAFTGKTPMNSASALLTNNCDRHFIQFRPPGARCYHFKLAYDPGDFESATRAYNEWMEVLITKDWPLCFGPEPEPEPLPGPQIQLTVGDIAEESRSDSDVHNVAISAAVDVAPNGALPVERQEVPERPALEHEPQLQPASGESVGIAPGIVADSEPPVANNIPTCWRDIVEVKPSSIPNAGNGLFAVCDLPGGIPLGFYFGVPMTEDEFDSLKEKVGLASHYSIMYRKTVLDATDKDGMPYTDPDGPLYCPFHFMNEDREGQRYNITFLEGVKVNQIICLTSRAIKRGEELFVSYGDEVDRSHWDDEAKMEPSVEGGDSLSSPPRSWMMRGATSVCSPIRMANGSAADSDINVAKKEQSDLTRLLKSLSTTAPANTPDKADTCSGEVASDSKQVEPI
ncbi:hypothetical protein GGI03_002142 [Coemansia sp. RSA 2337]|nr:hypothetical protein GGI14_004971 [Coemansia sp. S680]KAJ2466386.1 hypothetical protein GGI03_002142 [Coemansia sp. RSA 2337]